MKSSASKRAEPPRSVPPLVEASAEDFVGGAAWSFGYRGEILTYYFADDVWHPLDRLPKDGTKARFKLDFTTMSPWLKEAGKAFIAHQWLERRKSAQQLKLILINLGRFQQILCASEPADGYGYERFSGPLESLNRFHGERVAAELARKARRGAEIQRSFIGQPQRDLRQALQKADALVPETIIRLAGHLNAFGAWLRGLPQPICEDFEIRLPSEVSAALTEVRVLGADNSKIVSYPVLTAVLAACNQELKLLADAEAALAAEREAQKAASASHPLRIAHATKRMWSAYNRAVKGQAVRLQFLAARRRASVATLPLSPQVEKPKDLVEGHKVVYIWFTVFKQYGDEGVPERVPFPGFMGEEAMDALRVTRELTDRIRLEAAPEDRSRLFLVRAQKGVRAMNGNDLQVYLNSTGSLNPGLIQRYEIEGAEGLTSHHARHTNATRIVEAGGSVTLAARYLGHLVTDGNPLFAWLFYIAGNTPEGRERMATELDKGAASGIAFNAVARVAAELVGGEATAADVPPNEMSYHVALERLRNMRMIEDDDITPEQLERRLKQGYVLNVTRYGGCFLQATSGPCLTPEKCVVGIDPESPAVQAGEGCTYQVLMPHGLEMLREEEALMEVQIEFFEREGGYDFWLARERRQLEIWRKQIARAEALQARMESRPHSLPVIRSGVRTPTAEA